MAEFCRSVDAKCLLDVSGGQGGLGKELKAFDIETTTTDYGALPGSPVLKFSLAEYDITQIKSILQKVSEGGDTFVTTCFDVLEHIDKEHVSAAVYNLYSLTHKFLVVSISTRPSAFDNLLHATIMPIQAWIGAFSACGFRLVKNDMFKSATSVPIFSETDDLLLISRWQAADMFDDVNSGEPIYLVFEKVDRGISHSTVEAAIEEIVDVSYRKEKRKQFKFSDDKVINFNLHYQQEWSLFRPLLDVIPRSQARFLIRPGAIQSDMLRAIHGYLNRNGVEAIIFNNTSDLPWEKIKGQILVTGAESTATPHLMSQEVVALARLHGCQTYLFQHGIWPRPFEQAILTFASENVVLYSSEERRRLNERTHSILKAKVPWGMLPADQVMEIGSAKFADHLICSPRNLSLKFGYEADKYTRTVLIGTKNLRGRWGINNIDDGFLDQICSVVEKNKDVLFIIRPHPLDRANTFQPINQSNVRLYDEVVGLLADLSLSRVLPFVDLVATSPSSLIVDASITSRPTLVYETGQPVEFDGITTRPFEWLQQALNNESDLASLKSFSTKFKDKYAEKVDEKFYEKFSNHLKSSDTCRLSEQTAVMSTLLSQIVESMRATQLANQAAASLKAQIDADMLKISDLREENDRVISEHELLTKQVCELNAKNREIINSVYWRSTAPLRLLARALRSIRKVGN
ncbi:hypothetical protein [Methylobacterium sp. D54C]